MASFTDDFTTIYNGDCLDVMRGMEPCSVDSIVTDPPYGLAFMGKHWDHGVPGTDFWLEALRVAKPGAHLVAFGGTRTYHRLACAIEDAGWEIRDCLGWLYGSGFPKSLNVSKAIDRAAGAEREVVGTRNDGASNKAGATVFTAPATPDAIRWQGYGTALKPAWEPIILARKPLCGTVATNVLTHGTGALNIDGCRVATDDKWSGGTFGGMFGNGKSVTNPEGSPLGRWPANILHDGSDEVLAVFPQTQTWAAEKSARNHGDGDNSMFGLGGVNQRDADSGSAARFFYCAKASKRDRDEGLDGFEEKRESDRIRDDGVGGDNPRNRTNAPRKNHHPTVKPTDLMRWLVRLVTPPGGAVLDPFMGSGSTLKAARLEGFRAIGIDLEADYCEIAAARARVGVGA